MAGTQVSWGGEGFHPLDILVSGAQGGNQVGDHGSIRFSKKKAFWNYLIRTFRFTNFQNVIY